MKRLFGLKKKKVEAPVKKVDPFDFTKHEKKLDNKSEEINKKLMEIEA